MGLRGLTKVRFARPVLPTLELTGWIEHNFTMVHKGLWRWGCREWQ